MFLLKLKSVCELYILSSVLQDIIPKIKNSNMGFSCNGQGAGGEQFQLRPTLNPV